MLRILNITAQAQAGMSILDAIIEAKKLASTYDTYVQFRFNMIELEVAKNTSEAMLANLYHERLAVTKKTLRAHAE